MNKILILLTIFFISTFSFSCNVNSIDNNNQKENFDLEKNSDSLKNNMTNILSQIDSLTKEHPIGMKVRKHLLPIQWDIKDFHEQIEIAKNKETDRNLNKIKDDYQTYMNHLLKIAKEINMIDDYNKFKSIFDSRLSSTTKNQSEENLLLTKYSNDIYMLNIIVAEQLFNNAMATKDNE